MKTKRKLFGLMSVLFTLTLMFAGNVSAIPAYPKPLTVTQSNGKTLTYRIYGDEHVNWTKTTDGYTLIAAQNGDLVYAVNDDNGDMIASSVIASNPEQRSASEKRFLASLDKNVFYSAKQLEERQQMRLAMQQSIKKVATKKFTTSEPRFLVVLVNYTDVAFSDDNAKLFYHQIQDSAYTVDGATGSVRDYFADNSFNSINPHFDVYGPVTLPHERKYYAENNYRNAWQMGRDAVLQLDTTENVDFSVYDNDGDGEVDLIHIVFAGQGANTMSNGAGVVWPHMFYFQGNTRLDGKRFNRYACSSEHNGARGVDGIGAVCHEMGHAFGLPDMYDTDYEGSGGESVYPGSWDVMAAGSYNNRSKTPPYYSMVERDMLGWGNIVNLTDGENKLYPIADSNTAYKLHLNKDEYLMFEYRNHDKWDAFLPGVGMLVWHADTSQFVNWEANNDVNVNPDDRGYYIECADGDVFLETARTPYPGKSNVTEIPALYLTNGTQVEGFVDNIHYDGTEDSTILFTYHEHFPVQFTLNVSNITITSAEVTGSITSDETIVEQYLEYKKSSDSKYEHTYILSNDKDVKFTLDSLEINTAYNVRLGAKVGEDVYYCTAVTFLTKCTEGIINQFPYTEGFEDGMGCWQSEGEYARWQTDSLVYAYNQLIAMPYDGEHFVHSAKLTSDNTEQSTKLISPLMDLTQLNNAALTFAHMEVSGATPALTVYYRLSEDGEWKSLSRYNTSMQGNNINNKWHVDKVTLSEVSATFQIAFEARDNYLAGVMLDNITIAEDTGSVSLADVAAQYGDDIKILPNPVNTEAVLHVKGLSLDSQVIITDAAGRIMDTYTLKSGVERLILPVASYKDGVYSVKVKNHKKVLSAKFIKL